MHYKRAIGYFTSLIKACSSWIWSYGQCAPVDTAYTVSQKNLNVSPQKYVLYTLGKLVKKRYFQLSQLQSSDFQTLKL